MSETNNQYIKSDSLNASCNFIGTCEEEQLFESGENTFLVKGRKNGDIVYTSDTDQIYMWVDNDWTKIGSYNPDIDKSKTKYKKIIPYPTNCVNCGALLHDYVCEACGTEHPSFEYIIEEE